MVRKIFFAFFASMLLNVANASLAPIHSVGKDSLHKNYKMPTVKMIQYLVGRKLTLKEKVAFFFIKRSSSKISPPESNKGSKRNPWALIGLIMSLMGFLFFPLWLPAFLICNGILRKEKGNPGSINARDFNNALTGKRICIWGAVAYAIIIGLVLFLIAINFQFGPR